MASKLQIGENSIGVYADPPGNFPIREMSNTISNRSVITLKQISKCEIDPINNKIIFSTGIYTIWEGKITTEKYLYIDIDKIIATRIILQFSSAGIILLVIKLDFDFYETMINTSILYQSDTNPIGVGMTSDGIEITTTVDILDLNILSNIMLPIRMV